MKTPKLPILLVHGMWGHPSQWTGWIKEFEKAGHTTVPLTLKGHGPNDRPEYYSFADYVNQVRKSVRAMGPCILLGHSMGGLIAQKVANFEPCVQKVVLVASAAPKGIPRLTWRMFLRLLNLRYIRALVSGKAYSLKSADARDLMMNCLDMSFDPNVIFQSQESGRVTREILFGSITVEPIEHCATIVVGGTHDRMTPLRTQRAIAFKHQASLITYTGGHLPMFEKCSKFVSRSIVEYLECT